MVLKEQFISPDIKVLINRAALNYQGYPLSDTQTCLGMHAHIHFLVHLGAYYA